jgi:transposase
LEILYTHVAGIDVHKKQVTVTVRTPDAKKPAARRQKTRTFPTYYGDLLAMAAWFVECGVTHAAMESTGVYWWPVYSALQEAGGGLTIEVVNAAHVKNVPGRKTDVKDSQWLAELMEVGLLRGGFLPPRQVRVLRDYTRYQTKLTEERTREKQRLLKVLESAGIKLDCVASDTFGVSGRLMLAALVAGERDPLVLAGLAKGALRNKSDDLRLALTGRFSAHHATMVELHLARIDHLDAMLARVAEKIGALDAETPAGLAAPFAEQIAVLTSIPGVGERVATVIVSEIGVDMGRFPSAAHLAAWAGLAPGNNESAGRRRRTRHRKGNTHVQSILVEAALAASRTRSRIGARFHRLHRRFGGPANKTAGKKAAFAVAHTLIKVIWSVLATGTPYTDLGHDYYTRRVNPETQTRRLIAQLEAVCGKKIILVDDDGAEPPQPGAT